MAASETIQPLVDKYTYHRDAYLRAKGSDYNEAQLRQDFTDPFFHAPGWDVNNNKSHSEAYREVLHEEQDYYSGKEKPCNNDQGREPGALAHGGVSR